MNATPQMLIGMMVLLLVFALLLVGLLVRTVRRGSEKKTPAENKAHSTATAPSVQTRRGASVAASDESEPGKVPAPTVAAEMPLPEPDAVLIMQVWQDGEGRLIVEAQGQRYRRLFEIRDGEVGRRVLETINRLDEFAQGQEPRVPSTSSPAKETAPPPPAPDYAESDAVIDRLRAEEEMQPQKFRITADPLPFRPQNPAQRSNITLNLAREVDELLQVRLKASPEFAQRYIHVAGARDGTLRFDVDGGHYGSLQEVPDLQVRKVIQAAIADWETRR